MKSTIQIYKVRLFLSFCVTPNLLQIVIIRDVVCIKQFRYQVEKGSRKIEIGRISSQIPGTL